MKTDSRLNWVCHWCQNGIAWRSNTLIPPHLKEQWGLGDNVEEKFNYWNITYMNA